jgi:3-hydroxyisobutyrate dehydrogenase-like beta-hydroxyacid dehydrogenase
MKQKIGIVGLGRMGANMARRLKACGYLLSAVYDVNHELAAALSKELGAPQCPALADVVAASEVILTVVTDDRAMRAIFAPSGDSLLQNAAGRTFINCATVSPQVHVEVASAAARVGAHTLEACMASSITQAREGTLYLMLGGERAVFERLSPLLKQLSSNMRYVGETGQAAKVKALVNMVMNINTAGLAEGLGLANAMGLDLTILREIFSQTGAASRVLLTDGEDMQNRDHACFFSAAHAAKDSGIALELAQAWGLQLPLAAATKAQYDRMVASGLGELDKSGIAELTFPGRGPGA